MIESRKKYRHKPDGSKERIKERCIIKGCERPSHALDFCLRHYIAHYRKQQADAQSNEVRFHSRNFAQEAILHVARL